MGNEMEEKMRGADRIDYVVGTEKGLTDVLSGPEVMPLLKGVVLAGIAAVAIKDSAGRVLWACGRPAEEAVFTEDQPVYLEGEEVGRIAADCGRCDEALRTGLLGLLREAVGMCINTNLKRMLTTEMHTTVVTMSYDELLETNRRLAISEAKYRELAESLEKQVAERTEELRKAHARLLQQEKMASVGQLAAGMAHEINNPLGFIVSNLHTLGKYAARYREMLEFFRAAPDEAGEAPVTAGSAQGKWKELKIDFIFSDAEELIGQCLYGAERVRKIVSDLKGFSHIEDGDETPVMMNEEIDRTLNVLAHEIPEGAEIIKDYKPLTAFVCNPGLICQVFLNIILNALQARREGLRLTIGTGVVQDKILISFSDNGPGIPDDIKHRVFEPFFTTKDVGKGTGMGLAVAYEIITGYGGTVEVESSNGQGTTLLIQLPVKRGEHV